MLRFCKLLKLIDISNSSKSRSRILLPNPRNLTRNIKYSQRIINLDLRQFLKGPLTSASVSSLNDAQAIELSPVAMSGVV